VDGGVILLVALAVLAAVLLFGLGYVAFSRFVGPDSGRGRKRVPCCYRMSADQDWRRGTLRYDQDDRLDHYGPGGLSLRPEHRWLRSRLDLGIARPMPVEDCPALPRGTPPTGVSCRYGEDTFELALGHEHYTALRSWLESVPPGWNANVA